MTDELPEPGSEDFSRSELLEDQRRVWRGGLRILVEVFLSRWPVFAANEDLILDLIFNEVVLREEGGEVPAAQEYLERFPQYAEAVRRMLEMHTDLKAKKTEKANTRLEVAAGASPRRKRRGRIQPPNIPGYEILAFIDGGGQGDVYRARHIRLDRPVALKILRPGPDDDDQVLRFRREGRLSARLDHPNIVRIYDFDEYQGHRYFSMEFLEGGSLKDRLEQDGQSSPLPAAEAAELLLTLAAAVAYAHRKEIIHRDLKPGNVLFSQDDIPKVADFGLAKRLDSDTTELTDTHKVLGTASYMAPEQAAGKSRHATAAADVYGLGAILYSCLTGRPPFEGEDWLDVLLQVRTRAPVSPRRHVPSVPPELERICLKCLEKVPDKRPAGAAGLATELRDFLAGEAKPSTVNPTDITPAPLDQLTRADPLHSIAPDPDSTLNTVVPLVEEEGLAAGDVQADGTSVWNRILFSIPGYEILEELGRGGMGVVYKARQLRLKRIVALKAIHQRADTAWRWRRLQAEAEFMATLNHPNIVQIYDLVEHQGVFFIAMEFLEGGALSRHMHSKLPPPSMSAELMEQVARALGFIHKRGLVHRDVKPHNILLTERPKENPPPAVARPLRAFQVYGLPKVTDLGLMHRIGQAESLLPDSLEGGGMAGDSEAFLTRSGEIVGTPSYMSPEQARGEANQVSPASDVWSLGATLYELLTGQPPFRETNVMETLHRVMFGEPTSPCRLNPGVPRPLASICLRCLEKDPPKRYPDGDALADDLHTYLEKHGPNARPRAFWKRLFPWGR